MSADSRADDIDIDGLLRDLARQQPSPAAALGTFERLWADAHQPRHARMSLVASVVGVAVIALGASAVTHQWTSHRQATQKPAPATTQTAPPTSIPLSTRLPRWLPSAIRAAGPAPWPSSAGRPSGPAPVVSQRYTASGDKTSSRSVVTFQIFDDSNLGPACPLAEVEAAASSPHVPHCNLNPLRWTHAFVPIDENYPQVIHGWSALIAQSNTAPGYGTPVVEWRENNLHFVLWSDRVDTKLGPVWVSVADLVRMAQSVPEDPSIQPASKPAPVPDIQFPAGALPASLGDRTRLAIQKGADIDYLGTQRVEGADYLDIAVFSDYTWDTVFDSPDLLRQHKTPLGSATINGVPADTWSPGPDEVALRWTDPASHRIVIMEARGYSLNQLIALAQQARVVLRN